MKHFIEGSVIAFDTETTGLNSYGGDSPFAFSFCNCQGQTAYFEFGVDPFTRKPIPDKSVLDIMSKLLEDEKVIKVGHNFKFDCRMMDKAYGIKLRGPGGLCREGGKFHDTMFMAHACDTLELNYKLKRLAKAYAGIDDSDEKELQSIVVKLRRRASKLGWNIAFDRTEKPDGTQKKKGVVAADYWLPGTMNALHPDLCPEEWAEMCQKYAVLDSVRTMMLAMFYLPMMRELDTLQTYLKEIEQWPVVYAMEERGVRIDPEELKLEIKDTLRRRDELMPTIQKAAWEGFNIDSNDHLRELLYNRLKLTCRPDRLTDGGKSGNRMPSVDVDAMNDHKDHPVVQGILRYRGAGKAYGFFKQYQRLSLPDPINPHGRVLHGDIRQLGPATGRFSMAIPNLQQVTSIESSRSAEPIDGRGAFGPRPGYWWLHNDYKGMEVRVFAFVSGEPHMLQAISEGREIHDEVCNRGWGGPYNEAGITECIHVLGLDGSELGSNPELVGLWKRWEIRDWRKLTDGNRRELACSWMEGFKWDIVKAQESIGKKVTKNKGKMVTFAKIYGGGADAVKDLLHVTKQEAAQFLRDYNKAFPRIDEYARDLQQQAASDGYVRSLWGRRMTIAPGKEYRCVNYIVQGSSADLLKSAMIKTHYYLKNSGLGFLLLTIHDELVFEVPIPEFTFPLVRKICALMEDTDGKIGITMPTDPSVVKVAWKSKEKIKLPPLKVGA